MCAIAEGSVLSSGWDPHYGNTVVVSAFNDTLRVVYMHLQTGRVCECMHAWQDSISLLEGPDPERWMYEEIVQAQGCDSRGAEAAARAGLCPLPGSYIPKAAAPSDLASLMPSPSTPSLPAPHTRVLAGDVIGLGGRTGPRGVLHIVRGGAKSRSEAEAPNASPLMRIGLAVRQGDEFIMISVHQYCSGYQHIHTTEEGQSLCDLLHLKI